MAVETNAPAETNGEKPAKKPRAKRGEGVKPPARPYKVYAAEQFETVAVAELEAITAREAASKFYADNPQEIGKPVVVISGRSHQRFGAKPRAGVSVAAL